MPPSQWSSVGDAVLTNTAIRKPLTPLMARAMRKAIEAAREARLSGRMPKEALLLVR
jgi:thiazole synthase ThiGH ThiG subunit